MPAAVSEIKNAGNLLVDELKSGGIIHVNVRIPDEKAEREVPMRVIMPVEGGRIILIEEFKDESPDTDRKGLVMFAFAKEANKRNNVLKIIQELGAVRRVNVVESNVVITRDKLGVAVSAREKPDTDDFFAYSFSERAAVLTYIAPHYPELITHSNASRLLPGVYLYLNQKKEVYLSDKAREKTRWPIAVVPISLISSKRGEIYSLVAVELLVGVPGNHKVLHCFAVAKLSKGLAVVSSALHPDILAFIGALENQRELNSIGKSLAFHGALGTTPRVSTRATLDIDSLVRAALENKLVEDMDQGIIVPGTD